MATTQEIHDWLGDSVDQANDEQIAQLVDLATAINERWPDADLADVRERALSGAAQIVLGDDTLEGLAAAWHRAREVERHQMDLLTGALLASSTGARGEEASLTRRVGAARDTVRKALGK